jgi:adenosylcobinamide kinase/adenosylcobinamide-phosphate guanylyltransferase
MLTFLVGGARSGKSTLAQRMAERSGMPVTVIATAEPFDDDLRARIERHRADRPDGWNTVETPLYLGDAVRATPHDRFLVIDCITVWVGNLMHHFLTKGVDAAVGEFLAALRERHDAPTVVVSNEVGMGVHPETELGRQYRDILGTVNQRIADTADTSLLLVAGRAVRLDDPWRLMP